MKACTELSLQLFFLSIASCFEYVDADDLECTVSQKPSSFGNLRQFISNNNVKTSRKASWPWKAASTYIQWMNRGDISVPWKLFVRSSFLDASSHALYSISVSIWMSWRCVLEDSSPPIYQNNLASVRHWDNNRRPVCDPSRCEQNDAAGLNSAERSKDVYILLSLIFSYLNRQRRLRRYNLFSSLPSALLSAL